MSFVDYIVRVYVARLIGHLVKEWKKYSDDKSGAESKRERSKDGDDVRCGDGGSDDVTGVGNACGDDLIKHDLITVDITLIELTLLNRLEAPVTSRVWW